MCLYPVISGMTMYIIFDDHMCARWIIVHSFREAMTMRNACCARVYVVCVCR